MTFLIFREEKNRELCIKQIANTPNNIKAFYKAKKIQDLKRIK